MLNVIPPIFVQYSFDLPPRPLHSIILIRSEVWSGTKISKRNLIGLTEKRKNRELRESYINPDNIAIKKANV